MTTLHIHCGDSSAGALRASGVMGEVFVWREIYTEGPVPGGLTQERWYRVRAEFLTTMGLSFEDALRGVEARYRRLAEAGAHDEVVLWFDACMFDQTIMIHLIDRLGNQDLGKTRLSLICIADRGLGELHPDELAALLGTRQPITPEQVRLAHDAWVAFTAPGPREIEVFLERDGGALPYLAAALKRHLQQFPSVRNGLNRLQNQALEVIASGTHGLGAIFREVSQKEDQPFFGDTTLWACLDGMARCNEPLLTLDGPGSIVRPVHEPLDDLGAWTVTASERGRQALRGECDWVRDNGIDVWLGGVHLSGAESPWRWDEARGQLVRNGGG